MSTEIEIGVILHQYRKKKSADFEFLLENG